MEKKPFLTEAMAQQIIEDVPTPFHVYDEKGIRENVRRINKAFSWNKGFKEYFAVKALPNPVILQILKEEGCGVDCSSLTELMLSEALRLYRPRDHVLLQPDPCGGYAEGLRAGRLHQSGRRHHGGVSGAGGRGAAGDLLPL